MRILFGGTAEFAVPCLKRLAQSRHELLGVFTQPDRPAGRKRIPQPSPVKSAAQALGLTVYQPERLRKDTVFLDAVRAMQPDVVVYAAYGQILPSAFLSIPRHGCWNIHGSLLPKYRGAAPIQWAIANGDSETGVCVMIAEAGLDTGPVLTSTATAIQSDDTAGTLTAKLALLGADLMMVTIDDFEAGLITPQPQDEAKATHAPSITREHARIDWKRPAVEIGALIRAMNPKPGAWTVWRGQEFKIWSAIPMAFDARSPGDLSVPAGHVLAGTGGGALALTTVQPAGKKPMPAVEWARGWHGDERFEL